MGVIARSVTEADLPLLAEMNKRLIADEGSCNPMTTAELQQRMSDWRSNGWEIRLFLDNEPKRVVGYAVYQLRSDDYFPENKVVYLRQLYVERMMRSQGIGRRALQWLIEHEFLIACKVVIDVLATNPRGYAFWKRMGFEPYYTNMRLEIPSR